MYGGKFFPVVVVPLRSVQEKTVPKKEFRSVPFQENPFRSLPFRSLPQIRSVPRHLVRVKQMLRNRSVPCTSLQGQRHLQDMAAVADDTVGLEHVRAVQGCSAVFS